MATNQHPTRANLITRTCTGRGGHPRCRAAYREGLPVHVIPTWSADTPAVVLPSYHFATEAEALAAVEQAQTAPLVRTDADLYRYRAEGVAYRLPVGWVDPSRRRPQRCDAYARKGTGYGACDAPLDERGQCAQARNHVDAP